MMFTAFVIGLGIFFGNVLTTLLNTLLLYISLRRREARYKAAEDAYRDILDRANASADPIDGPLGPKVN